MYLTNLQEDAKRTRQYASVRFDDDYPQQKDWQIALQKFYFSISNEERSDLLIKLNELYKTEKNIEEMGLLRDVIELNIQSTSDIDYFDNECVYLVEPFKNQQIASHALYRHLRNNSSENLQNHYPDLSYEFNCQTSILKISQPLLTVCSLGRNQLTLNLEGYIEGNLVPNEFKFQIVNKEEAYLKLPEFLTRDVINSTTLINALRLDLKSPCNTHAVSELAGVDTEIKMLIPISDDKKNHVLNQKFPLRICDVSLNIKKLEKIITSRIHRKEFV
ncbi:hypothetical protein VCR3J2_310272 [Vibrio coralliirubri]|uniref:hypothetical protein n=1 Tax=Vibrio coralliirubri TaxID=1516159 RepID=UPI0006377512|nr:hypothetical protein [Vibrio coralliirubri]CDT86997.1 hypothetical protein VCR3J2_310272 [Vibrio coralliirubri]